ncbi:hypothetical protein MTO96_021064 [Rhipicephalus appendiculatus]
MRHTVRWTEIAVRLTESHQKVFSAGALFATGRTCCSRNTLSETEETFAGPEPEEEYSELNQLLEEISTIAKENWL